MQADKARDVNPTVPVKAVTPDITDEGSRAAEAQPAVPDTVKDSVWRRASNFGASLRRAAIEATPAAIVNHGSNVAAAMHLASEVMMFQASAKEPLVKDKSNPLNYILQPPKVIFNTFLKGSGSKHFKASELLNPSFLGKAYNHLTDLKSATERDRVDAGASGRLPNRWQMRATLTGLCTWTMNLLLPDVKDTQEETEKMTKLVRDNPIGYIGLRLKQAVWAPDWLQHKRQMTGLGVLLAGTCSTLGAWRNREKLVENLYQYKFNGSYMMTGLISVASAIPMLFEIDNDRGYARSGSMHLLRSLFLPTSIYNKFKAKETGRQFYTAGAAGFQIENATVALIAGAEKKEDGSIVDHKAFRDEAKRKYHEQKAEQVAQVIAKDEDEQPSPPGTTVSHAQRHSVAKEQERSQIA